MNKDKNFGKKIRYENYEGIIAGCSGKDKNGTSYLCYLVSEDRVYDKIIKEKDIQIIDDYTKKENEIYPWEVFSEEDRPNIEELSNIEDYNEHQTYILMIMKYNAALKRAEEIIKRVNNITVVDDEPGQLKNYTLDELEKEFLNQVKIQRAVPMFKEYINLKG